MCSHIVLSLFFFFNDTATTEIYTLSLHDALPIFVFLHEELAAGQLLGRRAFTEGEAAFGQRPEALDEGRSEEHTSELQSRRDLVCRLLLDKKKKKLQNTVLP